MKILALDFSTLNRSIAILELSDGHAEILQSFEETGATRFAAPSPFTLFPQNFDAAQIEAIAVGLGPGSYTGIRSSLAMAQGWNLARNIPAAGVSSADAIALEAAKRGLKGEIEVVIDAQRNEIYSGLYEVNAGEFKRKGDLQIVKQPRGAILVGPEAKKWSSSGVELHPSAWAVGKLSAKLQFGPPEKLEPIYLREPSFVKAPAVRHA